MIKVAPGNTENIKYSDTENRLNRSNEGHREEPKASTFVADLLIAGGEAEETIGSRRDV
jgi:hypothetical protein